MRAEDQAAAVVPGSPGLPETSGHMGPAAFGIDHWFLEHICPNPPKKQQQAFSYWLEKY